MVKSTIREIVGSILQMVFKNSFQAKGFVVRRFTYVESIFGRNRSTIQIQTFILDDQKKKNDKNSVYIGMLWRHTNVKEK